jgi:site-specific recombinase XerC
LFDWLVTGHVVAVNPAASVRGPAHSVKRGKTPVLVPDEARQLIDAIDVTTHVGLRDRVLIGLMVYSFAHVGAALAMKVEDVYVQNRRLSVRLQRRAASAMRCPATTILKPTFTPTSTVAGSPAIRRSRCFGQSVEARAS